MREERASALPRPLPEVEEKGGKGEQERMAGGGMVGEKGGEMVEEKALHPHVVSPQVWLLAQLLVAQGQGQRKAVARAGSRAVKRGRAVGGREVT